MDYIIVLSMIVLLVAYIIQGISGFGRSLFAAPILSLFMPANEVVAILLLSGFVANIYLLIKTIKYSEIKKIWVMIVFGIASTLIGVKLLASAPILQLKIAMGVTVVVSAIILSSGYRLKIKENVLVYGITGAISGFFTGMISMGGPVVVLLLQNQNHEKHKFRGNLTLFFFITGFIAIVGLFTNNLITPNVLTKSLYLLPVSIIGIFLGDYISYKLNENVFKKIVIVILFIAGLSAILTTIL